MLLNASTTPISGTAEEQFISLPDSPKASASTESAEQASKALAEQTTAVSPAGRELPWNQASTHIRSPLLRLHTGERVVEHVYASEHNEHTEEAPLHTAVKCLLPRSDQCYQKGRADVGGLNPHT